MNRLFFYRHSRHFTCLSAALLLRSSSYSECLEESRSRYSNFIADAVELAAPSVVNIQCEVNSGFMHGMSSGSGFIIDGKSGLIVTNAHVVSKAAPNKRINIRLWNSGITRTAVLHSLDADSDIALLKLDKVDDDLPVAKMGSSATLRAGEFVCALGSPLMLQNTVTAGIISSTARHSSELGLGKNLNEYIQTDCSINQGNSGGPLVNMRGEVVGVNVMRAQADGISFSIPIDTVISVVKQLLRSGKVVRPKVGMRVVNYVETSQGNRKSGNAILDSGKGVKILIVDVEKDSAAERAGLRNGDIITAVQGKQTNGVRELLDIIGHSSDVYELEITVSRDGNEQDLYLKLK